MIVRKKSTMELMLMKTIDQAIASSKDASIELIHRERALMERIDHPFVAKLNYAFHDDEKLYFVTNFYNGGTFSQYMRQCAPLPIDQFVSFPSLPHLLSFPIHFRCRFYASQLLLALEYLHGVDIIYLNLRPENILF